MTDQTTANINLRLALERAALQESQAGVTSITKGLQDTKSAAIEAGSAVEGSFKSITDSAASATSIVSKLRSELLAAGDASKNIKQPSDGSFGLSDLSSFRSIGRATRQLLPGQVGGDLQKLGDIGLITRQFGELGKVFETLPGILGQAATEGTALAGGIGGVLAVLGPLALAIGAIALAFKVFVSDALVPANKALEEAVASVDAYYGAISKGTTDSIQKQLDTLEAQKKAVDDKVTTLNNSLQSGFADTSAHFGDLGARIVTGLEGVGAFGGGIQKLNTDLSDAQKQSDAYGAQIDGLKRALGDTTVATNDAAEAEKKLQAERDKGADAALAQAKANQSLIETGSSKSIQQHLDDLEAERKSIQNVHSTMSISAAESQKLVARLQDIDAEEKTLTNDVLPLVKAREAEDQAVKDQTKRTQDLANAYEKNQKATDNIIQQGADSRASIEAKYQDSVEKIAEQGVQARLNIEQSYGDKLIDIARKTAQSAADELTKLEQKFQDNETSLARGEQDISIKDSQDRLKLQIDAQRQEAKDLTDHLRNIEDIRRNAQAGEQSDLYNRNFTALLTARQGVNKQIEDENTRFVRQRQDQKTADAQKLQDEQSSIEQQRQARLLAYDRANEDAQKNYDRQLQMLHLNEVRQEKDAQIARDRSLQSQAESEQQALRVQQQGEQQQLVLLSRSITQKLQLQAQGYTAELNLLLQATQDRMKIVQQEAAAAQATATGNSTIPTTHVGMSGAASGGQVLVNDGYPGQRESFNGTKFPAGLGLFIPARSGTISDGGGSITINVNGAQDPEMVSRKVVEIIKRVQHA